MNTILLLGASTIMMHCDILTEYMEIKGSLLRLEDEQKSRYSTLTKPKEIAEEPGNYSLTIKRPIFEAISKGASGRTLFQSDIVLTGRQKDQIFKEKVAGALKKRQVFTDDDDGNSTWKDDQLVQNLFKLGAKVWTEATCVDFREDKNAQDKVVVVNEPEFLSAVGRLGGDQQLSLGEDNATISAAVHEIGHVLGFFHTMQRHDRDSYINISEQNIDPNDLPNFVRLNEKEAAVYGLTYDYGSIMHYDELSCSVNNQLTITALDPRYQKTMGSGIISFSDIYMINEHYGCNAKCNKSTSAKCTNEGYPHPRNCSTCICPSGYGGTLCDQRPPGCGEELTATRKKKTLSYKLGSGHDVRDQFDFCHYMITAPPGKKIEVDIRSISYGYDSGGCPKGGVEIKAQKDQKLTGYRFCSTKGSEGPVVSSSNRLPLILFNRMGTMEANFTYRSIN